ncbi:MAG: putative metal-dependent hydrolase [Acidobacteriota bacterium]|nr:putative metal-dependent hydrolase [Acidobacteriota bacterium]
MNDLRYPIGRFEHSGAVTDEELEGWIGHIEALPGQLAAAVVGLTDAQLDTPYRPEGWTIRQVVHHVPDSHLNAYVRFKWTLTEDRPTIKAYDEAAWAELPDTRLTPVATSLEFLRLLHAKWTVLLRSLGPQELQREFVHPEWGTVSLAHTVGTYAWHGRHHVAHINRAVEREGWR